MLKRPVRAYVFVCISLGYIYAEALTDETKCAREDTLKQDKHAGRPSPHMHLHTCHYSERSTDQLRIHHTPSVFSHCKNSDSSNSMARLGSVFSAVGCMK